MTAGRRICESIHMAALGIWLGALVITAASAAMLFPTMHRLEPSLPAYALYNGPHWLIAGGQIVSRMFLACDVAQIACLLTAGITLGVSIMWLGLSQRRVSTFLRVALLLLVLGVLAYRLGFLEPQMTQNLRAYWTAAAQGDNEAAAKFKAVFDAGHPVQSRLLGLTAALVLALIGAAVWSVAQTDRPETAGATEAGGLQEPLLARGRR